MRDWMIRAGKTFVQSFLGVLIPEIIYLLQRAGEGENIRMLAAGVTPFICSALAAGISAVWNIAIEKGKEIENGEND